MAQVDILGTLLAFFLAFFTEMEKVDSDWVLNEFPWEIT